MRTQITLFFLIVFSLDSHSAILDFKANQGTVEILAIGKPSALKIRGEGSGPLGSINFSDKELNGELELDLESIDTGIKLRNEHMKKKYLQTDTYPKAKLKLVKVDFQGQDLNKDFELIGTKFEGSLSLHGAEKPISGTVTISKKSSEAAVKANFKINIKDFLIEAPSFAGITVTEEVAVIVSTKATVQ